MAEQQDEGCSKEEQKSALQRITEHAKEFIEASPEEHKK